MGVVMNELIMLAGAMLYLGLVLVLGRFAGLASNKMADSEAAFAPRGSVQRLRELTAFAAWHREQLEGELQELCEAVGTHANDETLEREWCIEVIYHGLPLDELLSRIDRLKESENAGWTNGKSSVS
jgi:hypothetical protein